MLQVCLTGLLLALSSSDETPPVPLRPEGGYYHFQSFDDPSWDKNWFPTALENYTGKWEVETTAVPQALPDEKMIFMTNPNAYYGLSTQFAAPLDLTDKTLVVQYEVRLQENLECGGFYLKLFGEDNFSPATLCNETRYIIMFGPDKCGSTNKVHFIFRHQNSKTGLWEEKHMKDPPVPKRDKINHLYTLIVRPDNSFEILIDGESSKQGSLLTDFSPAVNPPKEIDDPTDSKPSDWVDDEKIPDPEAKKPDDWDESEPEFVKDPAKLSPPEGWLVDEPKFVADPEASKPEDWDDEIHGEWEPQTIPNPKCEVAPGCGEYEAPLIKNSLYKGKWRAPQIPNPKYKGPWKARQIPNPDYVEDLHPHNFRPLIGAGFELWMVNKAIGFNNVLIGTDEAAVHKWNKEHFIPKFKAQEEAQKKLEPEKKKKGAAGTGFLASLKGFGETFSDAFINLYTENAAASIILCVLVIAIPLLIVVFACRGSSSPRPVPNPAKKKDEDAKEGDEKEAEPEEEGDKEKAEEGQAEESEEKPVKRTPATRDRTEDNY
jgi:calnexin